MIYHRNAFTGMDPVPSGNPLRAMLDPPLINTPTPLLRSIRSPPARRESLTPLRCVRGPHRRSADRWVIPTSPQHPLAGTW